MKDKAERAKWEKMSKEEQMKAKNSKAMELEEIFIEYSNLELLGELEEEIGCAGFCSTPLFYFSQSTYDGYPDETCFMKTLNFMKEASGPLAAECRVIGVTLIILWFLSFIAIYQKDVTEKKEMDAQHYPQTGSTAVHYDVEGPVEPNAVEMRRVEEVDPN